MDNMKKLHRSTTDRVIAGVCGGLGEYFEMDSLVFRILMLLLLFMGGGGLLLYIILMLLMPKEGEESRADAFTDVAARVQEVAKEMKESRHLHPARRRTTLGLLIIFLGIVLLMNKISPGFIEWGFIWPLAIIAMGVILLSHHRNG